MSDTIRVKRANVLLDISPNEKENYMEKGFSIVDEKGNIIEEALSNNVGELRAQIVEYKETIKKLDTELEETCDALWHCD